MTAVSFAADDLTGASDVLAQAHHYGLDAVLVVGDDVLRRFAVRSNATNVPYRSKNRRNIER